MEPKSDIQLNQGLKVALTALALLIHASLAAAATPELVVNQPKGPAVIKCAYQMVCEVSWTGEAGDWTVFPAELGSIDWGTIRVRNVQTFRRGDQQVVAQTVELIPQKSGEFDSPEIRVAYLDPGATPPAESSDSQTAPPDSSASPSLRAEPFKIVVRTPRHLVWISGGLGASLLLTAVGWWSARRFARRPQPTTAESSASIYSNIQAMFHRIHQDRLDGRFYEFYQGLSHVAGQLGQPDLATRLAERGQRAGYAGIRPSEDDLDGDLRDVERVLSRHREEHTA